MSNSPRKPRKIKNSEALNPRKARRILHDGEVNGKPLTDKQRKYFGAVSTSGGSMGTGGEITDERIDEILKHYMIASLWSSNDNSDESGGEPFDANYGIEDISKDSKAKMRADVKKFVEDNLALINESGQSDEMIGHDFWLTRNGHGVGFWDRGLGEIGDKLTVATKKFGTSDLSLGDDGKVYVMGSGGKATNTKKMKNGEKGDDNYAKGGSADLLNKVKTEKKISEKEINLIKNRINSGKADEETKALVQWIWDNTPELTEEQNKKGLDFLMNLWKTPAGVERKNNPFGFREQEALETFKTFELAGFHDISRYGGRPFNVPLYNAIGKDTSFQYYYDGKVNIIGAEGGKMKDGGATQYVILSDDSTDESPLYLGRNRGGTKIQWVEKWRNPITFNSESEAQTFMDGIKMKGKIVKKSSGKPTMAGGGNINGFFTKDGKVFVNVAVGKSSPNRKGEVVKVVERDGVKWATVKFRDFQEDIRFTDSETSHEGGQLSPSVATLMNFASTNDILANEEAGIQTMASDMKWSPERTHQQYKRIFSYMTETAYNKENPETPIEMTEEERNEFANAYVDSEKPEDKIEEAKHHLMEANDALDEAQAKEESQDEETMASGGGVESLEKELHKLQRDLNSKRLQTYVEGDNSEEEMARQRERKVKLARFNEVLKLLKEKSSKYSSGGSMVNGGGSGKEKIDVKSVILKSDSEGVFIDTDSIEKANEALYFVWKRNKFSDVLYDITFQDGQNVSGSIDLEPHSFHRGHERKILSWHLNTFWNNLAKSDASYIAQEDKDYAKNLVDNYRLFSVGGSTMGGGGRVREVEGTYGSGKTPTTVFVFENRDGSSWYVAEGGTVVNKTYDTIEEGVNIEELSDEDVYTVSKPINSLSDLEASLEDEPYNKGGSAKATGKTDYREGSKPLSNRTKEKQKLTDKISKMEKALSGGKLSEKGKASMEKKLEKYKRDVSRRTPVFERMVQGKGKFFIEIPSEYRLKMNSLLHGTNLKPRYVALDDKLRITVDNKPKLNRLYKIYADMLTKKSIAVPALAEIGGKPSKVRVQK